MSLLLKNFKRIMTNFMSGVKNGLKVKEINGVFHFKLAVIFILVIVSGLYAGNVGIERVFVSSEFAGNKPEYAFDGDFGTRWESEWKTDPSWIAVELKEKTAVEALNITWENASGSVYNIEVSDNGKKWETIKRIEDGKSGEKRFIKLDNSVTTKYIRILGEKRTLEEYGYSIFEIEIIPAVPTVKKSIKIIKAESSSQQLEGDLDFSPELAFDNDTGTRWSSEFSDPQWLALELEQDTVVRAIKINWETASGKVYSIQVSKNKKEWETVAEIKDGEPNENRLITFEPVNTKYIRMLGEKRNGDWGYSIWEISVYR